MVLFFSSEWIESKRKKEKALQSQDLRIDQVKESYITRELNEFSSTELSTLYTKLLVHAIVLLTYSKDYMFFLR